jgi:hypothetical protein
MAQWFAVAAMTGVLAWFAATGTADAQTCAAPGSASTTCSGNCAAIALPTVTGPQGGSVQIPITFSQGPDDGQSGQGFDEVAAIAFTLGVPGTGDGTPLSFSCSNGDLAGDAVTVGASNAGNFTVVVENAQCTNRNRCLCPDTTAGQTLDNFVNLVVYGPKTLPEQGPVQIPTLVSGNLVTLKMNVASGTAMNTVIPLHVFSALDSGAKPQFAANLSIGDEAACDVTANTQNRSNVTFTDGMVTVSGTPPPGCVGDCNKDGMVTIGELITGVNIALGNADPSTCVPFQNASGMVDISQLIKGVNNALGTCPAA